jgi:hypothetical protein
MTILSKNESDTLEIDEEILHSYLIVHEIYGWGV